MLKTEKLTIAGNTYHVTQLGALRGREVLTQLLACAGPLLGDDGMAGLEKLKPGDVAALCDVFARGTDVELENGKRPNLADVFDLHFAGNYDAMLEWLSFAIKLNFGSFFTKALSKLAELGAAQGQAKSE